MESVFRKTLSISYCNIIAHNETMPSIVDVAKMANVSITTVSRVLRSNPHPVSEETRSRVLDAARALNYSPSALAQAMVTRDTHIVGVIVGDAMDHIRFRFSVWIRKITHKYQAPIQMT